MSEILTAAREQERADNQGETRRLYKELADAQAQLDAIRAAMRAYPDSDLVSLAETLYLSDQAREESVTLENARQEYAAMKRERDAANERAGRLADALEWQKSSRAGEQLCFCSRIDRNSLDTCEHTEHCDKARAALAEHKAATHE